MANSYMKGQRIKVTGTFKDVDSGAYVDPLVVTFRTRSPSGTLANHVYGVDVNVLRTAAGRYRYDLLLDEAGDWWLRWDSSGSHEGANEWRVLCCAPASPIW